MSRRIKVCMVGPSTELVGGVSTYISLLMEYTQMEIIYIPLNSAATSNRFGKILLLLKSYMLFTRALIFSKIDIVHLNPSLGRNSINRDSIFAVIAKIFDKKLFLQWHGWNPANTGILASNKRFFKYTLGHADQINILVSGIEPFLKTIGYKKRINLARTFISDAQMPDFKVAKSGQIKNILFLSTVSKNKGIYEAIDIFQELSKNYSDLKYIVAGDGEELETIKNRIPLELKEKITFTGYVTGVAKENVFSKSDLYLFPSHYEGMPISLLEAMGYGLPVVCSGVGAIPDFFEKDKMGCMLNNLNPSEFIKKIKYLISNPSLVRNISSYNQEYIKEYHLASICIAELEKSYSIILNEKASRK